MGNRNNIYAHTGLLDQVVDVVVRVIGVSAIIILTWQLFETTAPPLITPPSTQPAIETVITQVRGCDIIQIVQGDEMISAFPAPDQPGSCKIPGQSLNKKGSK